MGLNLIGMSADTSALLAIWDTVVAVVEVAVGLGLVIFVHELGHFLVAKLCGVKCEKFYLGFDIGGWKLWRRRWGETEYGIGILPLGGYIKMLGQEDNPARLKEEIERAKLNANADASAAPGVAAADEVTRAQQALYDPRSYLAQSVPKRMAIISAGVVMNLIFAFVVAVVAFRIGVREIASDVGVIISGEAAWQSDLKVGDQIIEIAGRKIRRFRDLKEDVSLGNIRDGFPIVVRRRGVAEPITITVKPDIAGLGPRIGVAPPCSTTLRKKGRATTPGSAMDEARPPFEPGDRIVKIDDQPIHDYGQVRTYLSQHPDKSLRVTVERGGETSDDGKIVPAPARVTIAVAPQPMLSLGLEMEMGEICAIRKDSPASAAGLRTGDVLRAIDDEPVGDPLTLPDRLRGRAGQPVTLTIERGKEKGVEEVQLKLAETDAFAPPDEGGPVAVPQLGVAYRVLNRVRAVLPDSPGGRAGLLPGDEIVRADVIAPDEETLERLKYAQPNEPLNFDAAHRSWPCLIYLLQQSVPGTIVRLRWLRNGETQSAAIVPQAAKDWFNSERGLLFGSFEFLYVHLAAGTWGEALAEGNRETLNDALVVYRLLQNLGSQVSLKAVIGPITLFRVAKSAAEEGLANLLLFLTLLSANLAVINFLPIPLLDGGHMVFLAWEGIRGKPANEHVQAALSYVGLAFVLALMMWALGLDFLRLIPR